MKRCPKCGRDGLTLADFYTDMSRPDCSSYYCRNCVRTKNRARYRNVPRKPLIQVRPIYLRDLLPKHKVLAAIKQGCKTQTAIRHATRLHIDQVTDALAELWDESKLDRRQLRRGRYINAQTH